MKRFTLRDVRMGRPRKLWSFTVGAAGHSVTVEERRPGGALTLRYWTPKTGETPCHWVCRSLKHNDRELGEKTARDTSAQLLASTMASAAGKATGNRSVRGA